MIALVFATPDLLAPPPPFPAIVSQAVERIPVAPGIGRATYRLATANGPLVISVVTVDPREPTARVGTALARDRIVSAGETVSGMAHRTGAVAGINADYFDIDRTGAPLGVLVRDGALLRSPRGRPAITVRRDRTFAFENFRFAGTVRFGAATVALTGINVFPPEGGISLLTPGYGAPADRAGVTVLDLAPYGAGRWRVTRVTSAPPFDATATTRLAYGTAARAAGPLPDVGDVLDVAYDTDPPLANIAGAAGGGPMLLQNGAAIDDPSGPNYGDRDKKIPATAAALLADGSLALVVVDGRHPSASIGVTRPDLITLLQALGATDAMLFDSGGSTTLAARVPGDAAASVVNVPSDGVERTVADALLVFSDAPPGPPANLVVRPGRIVALAGARIPLDMRVTDAAFHALGAATGPWRLDGSALAVPEGDALRAGLVPGAAVLHVLRAGLQAALPLEIVDRVARLEIVRANPNAEPGMRTPLVAEAFDARGRRVAADGLVRWSAHGAHVDADGVVTGAQPDAVITATAGTATATLAVGRREAPLTIFDDSRRAAWKFSTIPSGQPGSMVVDANALHLGYDFTAGGRAVYGTPDLVLGSVREIACTVEGDGKGAALRATLLDRNGDREVATFARAIDFTGPRRLSVKLPATLVPPITLHNLYVVGTLARPPVEVSGLITVRDCTAVIEGTAP